jgi:hypothetical protein
MYTINLDLINFLSHVMKFWRTTLNLSINNTIQNNTLQNNKKQMNVEIMQWDLVLLVLL